MAAGTHRQRKHSVGGAAKFYEEVPVSAKDFQVYALLDRARLLRELHQRLAGADAQHAEESNELEPGNLVDGTTRRRRRPRTGGSEAPAKQDGEDDSKGVAWAEDMAGGAPQDKPTWKNR